MRTSLRKKITIFFIGIALISSLTVAALTIYNTNYLFSDYVKKRLSLKELQWERLLTSYYKRTGSWDGVELLFTFPDRRRGMAMGQGHGHMANRLQVHSNNLMGEDQIVLTDNNYRVIASTYGFSSGSLISGVDKNKGRRLIVDGKRVGYLFINFKQEKGLTELERDFINSVIKSGLAAGFFVALTAGLLGIFFGRRIIKPLQKLIIATRRIARGDWTFRVKVNGDREVNELATAFNRMAGSLEKMDKARRNLVADVAHELRNPLAIIRGQFETLLDGKKKPTLEVLFSLNDEVLRLSKIVEDLQNVSLAEAGKLKLKRENLNLQELVQRYKEMLQPSLEEKNIKFTIEKKCMDTCVYADGNRIKQVILNLLTNAIRHVPTGGTIRVSFLEKGDTVQTEIFNSGSKISDDEKALIFERFYRADKSRARTRGGTGLGLAITKSFIEAHGGNIEAKNVEGGVSFYFTLPKN